VPTEKGRRKKWADLVTQWRTKTQGRNQVPTKKKGKGGKGSKSKQITRGTVLGLTKGQNNKALPRRKRRQEKRSDKNRPPRETRGEKGKGEVRPACIGRGKGGKDNQRLSGGGNQKGARKGTIGPQEEDPKGVKGKMGGPKG